MSYLLFVISTDLQVFTFDTKEEAIMHADAWCSIVPHARVLVARKIVDKSSEGVFTREEREIEVDKGISMPNDLDLLACLGHLFEEGGPDNFVEASQGGIDMEFYGGFDDAWLEWNIYNDEHYPSNYWGEPARAMLEAHGFVFETEFEVERYRKYVRAASKSDLVVITREALDIMRDVFHVEENEHWLVSLHLQVV